MNSIPPATMLLCGPCTHHADGGPVDGQPRVDLGLAVERDAMFTKQALEQGQRREYATILGRPYPPSSGSITVEVTTGLDLGTVCIPSPF
ncbi:hypothetical protein [Nocardia brasiliensis]|uniref:hypothetical protein n=1 Tax=Nocardia brasiliensis TaxID=37326 RepID=UPI0024560674|nr:hypothetical protein [Nocardia brasiliensis]